MQHRNLVVFRTQKELLVDASCDRQHLLAKHLRAAAPPLKASYYADGTAPLTTLACLTLQRLTN